MEAFTSILGALGGASGGIGKVLGAGSGIMGLGGLFEQIQMANKRKSALDRQMYYMKHPEAIAALTQKFEKPLNQGLIKGVGNVVQAEAGERGLSEAPGIYQQIMAQALAPYQQQNQQTAVQQAMAALGLPAEILSGTSGGSDMSSWLSTILPKQASPLPGSTGSGGGLGVGATDPWGDLNEFQFPQ